LPLVEAVQRILRSDTPRLRAAGGVLDQSLEEIAARAMARERDARYESAEAMANDLRAFLEGRRTRAADVVSAAITDEQLLAIGLASGDINVIDARTGKTLATFERGSSPVVSLRFCEDGRIAVVWKDGRSDNLRLPA
jgi:hypothetical protein